MATTPLRQTHHQLGQNVLLRLSHSHSAPNPLGIWSSYLALHTVQVMGPRFNLRTHLSDLLEVCAEHLVWPRAILERAQSFFSSRCQDLENWQGVADLDAQAFLDRFCYWSNSYDDGSMFYFIDEYSKQHQKDLLQILSATATTIQAELKAVHLSVQDNLSCLGKILGLSDHEERLLFYAILVKYNRHLRTLMVDAKVAHGQDAYNILANVLEVDVKSVRDALKTGAKLDRLGLIDEPLAENTITDMSDLLRVSDRLLSVMMGEYADETDMMSMFTHPVEKTGLDLNDFDHVGPDLHYLIALLKQASLTQAKGINILLYGAPGTGKTELAKLLASQAQCELYAVEYADNDGNGLSGRDRYRALHVSQAFLGSKSQALIVFDEVEDVFPRMHKSMMSAHSEEDIKGSIEGKAWVNQTLEKNPLPVIWIANAIDQIDPAFLRRFQFHVQLKNPPPQIREQMVRKHLQQFSLSNEFIKKLSDRPTLSPAQIHSAARFVQLTQNELAMDLEHLILRQLENADMAMGVKPREENKRRQVTQYNLNHLNLETRYEIPKVIVALAARHRGTLCFYGPPGTGKTALAEHIAQSLQKPLIIKRASDVLSKYVGETEQQIAAMFAQAEHEKAILLLDEADSMMQSRQMAVRNYEISEVNEMLQGMERFNGIFICTTNLFDRIDEAALRRFNFKIRFKPLTYEQRKQLFITEALGGEAQLLSAEHEIELEKMVALTPGDFATIKHQCAILGDTFSADEFIAQLQQEHRVKPDVRDKRNMGFLN